MLVISRPIIIERSEKHAVQNVSHEENSAENHFRYCMCEKRQQEEEEGSSYCENEIVMCNHEL